MGEEFFINPNYYYINLIFEFQSLRSFQFKIINFTLNHLISIR